MTPAEKQQRAEDTCIHVVAQMLADNLHKRADELAILLGRRWANLCIAVEGNVRRETCEKLLRQIEATLPRELMSTIDVEGNYAVAQRD